MKCALRRNFLALCLVCAGTEVLADVVIEDAGVTMSRVELEYIVSQWNPRMQRDAANDLGDRIELLNQAMASKKIAGEAMQMTPEKDGEDYWRKELLLRKGLQRFMVNRYLANLEVPDMSGLARERYATEKDKYAWVPPRRLSSHILLLCPADGSCDREATRLRAAKLLDELQAGADFEVLVKEHSQDPGSRNKKGRFDKWLEPGMPQVDREYLKAVFAIEEEGGYSGVVASIFGFHIIRLDETREGYYKPFDEVGQKIVEDLAQEYARLATKIFDEGYRFGDDLYIDGDVMEEIFSPYKTDD